MSMTIDAGAEGILGVRAAAKVLKLNPSTVSRYLQDYPSLNLGNNTRPKVDVAELRRHRAENVDPARRGSHAGRVFGEGEDDKSRAAGPNAGSVLLRARSVRETVMAQTARVDLDLKKKLLMPLAEVETGIFDAGKRRVSPESGSPYPGDWDNDLVAYAVERWTACRSPTPAAT